MVLKQKLENLLTPNLDLGAEMAGGQLLRKANLSGFLRLLALIFWVGAVGRALGMPGLSRGWVCGVLGRVRGKGLLSETTIHKSLF